jgi:plastocyanin
MVTTTGIAQKLRWLAIGAAFAVMCLALVGLNQALAAPASPLATASKANAVSIKGFAFHAKTTHVKKGARVTFTNNDRVTHTATKGGSFNTGRIAPGSSVTITFNKKGTYAFHCAIHSFMHGAIVVE